MLNRHQLRIKVFKALYAYENCRVANRQLAVEKVCADSLDSAQSKSEKASLKSRAKDLLCKMIPEDGDVPEAVEPALKEALQQGLQFYREQNGKDLKSLESTLLRDIANVQKGQFSILRLLLELAEQNRKIADERSGLKEVLSSKVATSTGLYDNKVIAKIRSADKVLREKSRQSVFNVDDQALLRDWYKGTLARDSSYKAYLEKADTTYADDWAILDHMLRQIIFKSETIHTHFEEADINWTENKSVIRSMVLKTMKSVMKEDAPLIFAEISYNWEDDEAFFRELFRDTVKRSSDMEALITSNLENWDINRIALTDKVILQTAICEMIAFPSIPVKVTINEYIEISKSYSTPKSKNFVNGLLDVISGKLLDQGVIKKSGRGLIDNK